MWRPRRKAKGDVVLALFYRFAVVRRMAHNQVEGDSGRNDGEEATHNQAQFMKCDSVVP
jgi:hypothetical protein